MDSCNSLVTVIITCYNQAHFLGEAIESALRQTCQPREVLVVDDGSTDATPEVVSRYPRVRYIRQKNQGVVAARNRGLRESQGEYLVYLDGDDRLVPDALEVGLRHFGLHPEAAFVSGHCRFINAAGAPIPTWPQKRVDGDHYLEMLRGCYIWMPAKVMFRRAALEAVAGFDSSADHSGDYDLYLKLTREYPVVSHGQVVAEYRFHDANNFRRSAMMLRSALGVLRRQRGYVKDDARREEAYRAGLKNLQDFYGEKLVEDIRAHVRARDDWREISVGVITLLRYYPRGFFTHAGRKFRRIIGGGKD